MMSKTSNVIGQTEAGDDVTPLGVPECLDYLDTKRPTSRVQYMIHTIQTMTGKEYDGQHLFTKFKTIVARYRLENLQSILEGFET